MVIALYTNEDRDPGFKYTCVLAQKLMALGAGVVLPEGAPDCVGLPREDYAAPASRLDVMLSVGGDGTFLSASVYASRLDIPIVGVNLGNLGYLAELSPGDDFSLQRIVNGDYNLQKRMMIDVAVERGSEVTLHTQGLNDAVVKRGDFGRILSIEMGCDGTAISSWPGDGIIVSTPTGSTAYAFSAGGPIIEPTVECMLVVPICAHFLNAHPVVFSGDSEITVSQRGEHDGGARLWVDGRYVQDIVEGDLIKVRRSSMCTRMIKLSESSFTALLSEKLS